MSDTEPGARDLALRGRRYSETPWYAVHPKTVRSAASSRTACGHARRSLRTRYRALLCDLSRHLPFRRAAGSCSCGAAVGRSHAGGSGRRVATHEVPTCRSATWNVMLRAPIVRPHSKHGPRLWPAQRPEAPNHRAWPLMRFCRSKPTFQQQADIPWNGSTAGATPPWANGTAGSRRGIWRLGPGA